MCYKTLHISYTLSITNGWVKSMVAKKTAALNIRIDPDIKEAIRIAADRERRSVANMIEMLIIKHCEEVGISIPEQQALFEEQSNE